MMSSDVFSTIWKRKIPSCRARSFLANLGIHLQDSGFCSDMAPLLRAGLAYDVQVAGSHVREALIMRLSA
jgi:hypothetical protein